VFADERRQKILELVRANGAVALRELARVVGSSEVTVRRDLRLLESQGLLDRRHGGAVTAGGLAPGGLAAGGLASGELAAGGLASNGGPAPQGLAPGGLSHEASYSEKSVVASQEKMAIGALAAGLVSEGDAICVGAGTTTQAFARHLTGFRELTVVTNSVLVAQELARARGVEVVMTGGTLRGSIYALVGSAAEQGLAGMRVQRVFMSGNGLTPERGLSTPNLVVAGVDRALAQAAEEVVVLADHTKIGLETMAQTVPVEGIDHLVTSDQCPSAAVAQFRAGGVQVHVARRADVDDPDG
jgi:DeoR/GlpR family transcriptional regulator of sugar metabolism